MNHVWSYDFVQHRTADGRAWRALNIIDEYTKEALADVFILCGPPEYVRSDGGPAFIAQKVQV